MKKIAFLLIALMVFSISFVAAPSPASAGRFYGGLIKTWDFEAPDLATAQQMMNDEAKRYGAEVYSHVTPYQPSYGGFAGLFWYNYIMKKKAEDPNVALLPEEQTIIDHFKIPPVQPGKTGF